MRTSRVQCDGQIPDHCLDVNVRGSHPVAVPGVSHQVLGCGGDELEMQLPADLGTVCGKRRGDMQRHWQDHLRLAESQAHLVVLVEGDRLRLGHRRLVLRGGGGGAWHLVHGLLALQSHRVLDARHDATGEVQGAHDVLAQLVRRLEQTKSAHDAPLVRDEVEVGSPACSDVLQVVQGDFQLRLHAPFLQERVGRGQLFVRFVAQRRHLVRLYYRGHGEDSDRDTQHLHVGVEAGSSDGDLVRVLDVSALVRGGTGERQGFFEEICGSGDNEWLMGH